MCLIYIYIYVLSIYKTPNHSPDFLLDSPMLRPLLTIGQGISNLDPHGLARIAAHVTDLLAETFDLPRKDGGNSLNHRWLRSILEYLG